MERMKTGIVRWEPSLSSQPSRDHFVLPTNSKADSRTKRDWATERNLPNFDLEMRGLNGNPPGVHRGGIPRTDHFPDGCKIGLSFSASNRTCGSSRIPKWLPGTE